MRCNLGKVELDHDRKIVSEMEGKCEGPVKSKITFFGESLPRKFINSMDFIGERDKDEESRKEMEEWFGDDEPGCDLMFVIGTALAVIPFSFVLSCPKKGTHMVLINLTNTDETAGTDFTDAYEEP